MIHSYDTMDSTSTSENAGSWVGTWECKFGKYKGQTYRWICENDVEYAKWLVTILKSEAAKNYMLSML